MTQSKLDPRTAAAEKRMMDAVLKPVPHVTPDPKTAAMCDDLMARFDEAEEKED